VTVAGDAGGAGALAVVAVAPVLDGVAVEDVGAAMVLDPGLPAFTVVVVAAVARARSALDVPAAEPTL
jgi:hypothetical protein